MGKCHSIENVAASMLATTNVNRMHWQCVLHQLCLFGHNTCRIVGMKLCKSVQKRPLFSSSQWGQTGISCCFTWAVLSPYSIILTAAFFPSTWTYKKCTLFSLACIFLMRLILVLYLKFPRPHMLYLSNWYLALTEIINYLIFCPLALQIMFCFSPGGHKYHALASLLTFDLALPWSWELCDFQIPVPSWNTIHNTSHLAVINSPCCSRALVAVWWPK